MPRISPFVEQWAHGSRIYANNNERVYGLDGIVTLSLASPEAEQETLGTYVYTEIGENIDDLAGLLIDTHSGSALVEQAGAGNAFGEKLDRVSRVYAVNKERVYALDGTVVLSHISPFAEKSRGAPQWQE